MYFRNRALFVITAMDTVILLIFCLLEEGPSAELAQLMFSFCSRLSVLHIQTRHCGDSTGSRKQTQSFAQNCSLSFRTS